MNAPVRAYIRPSQLPVSEFCPMAAQLNERSGISRAAVMSAAWHAKLAGNDTLIGELTPEERKEVAAYGTPTTTYVPDPTDHSSDDADKVPVKLDYDSAEKELHVQVIDRDNVITEGTLDFAWVREVNGKRWAFIGDLKRNTWTIPDGPDTLQLAAYGHAYAALRSCDGYTPGLWSGIDSEWTWGTPVDLTSPEALDLWLRLKRAAKNDARLHPDNPDKQRYVTGAHCSSCYGRMHCPEWADMSLHALNTGHEEITDETAAYILLAAKAAVEHAELLMENIKVFAERGGKVQDPTTKKVYLPVWQKGRKSLDQEALKAAGIELEKFQKQGKPFPKFDWRKP